MPGAGARNLVIAWVARDPARRDPRVLRDPAYDGGVWRIACLVVVVACDGAPGVAPDAGPDAEPAWATYTIAPGDHEATLTGDALAGFVDVEARDYQLAFDPSAAYVLTEPVEPEDQLDWNKLPGLSDCGAFDLSVEGVMFGWRWRIDLDPPRLEVTAYANASGVHQWPDEPLLTLSAAELAEAAPLRYQLGSDGADFTFAITGTIGGRDVDVATTLPRGCTDAEGSRWAAGLYFGGTSVAPSTITARMLEE